MDRCCFKILPKQQLEKKLLACEKCLVCMWAICRPVYLVCLSSLESFLPLVPEWVVTWLATTENNGQRQSGGGGRGGIDVAKASLFISDQYRASVPAENNKLFMLVTFASAATEIDKSLFLHLMTQARDLSWGPDPRVTRRLQWLQVIAATSPLCSCPVCPCQLISLSRCKDCHQGAWLLTPGPAPAHLTQHTRGKNSQFSPRLSHFLVTARTLSLSQFDEVMDVFWLSRSR